MARTITRRGFTLSGAAFLAAAAPARPVRLGGPIFLQSDDPRELAREHRRLGYRTAYVPKVSLGETARIKAIRDAFADEDVMDCGSGRVGQHDRRRCRQAQEEHAVRAGPVGARRRDRRALLRQHRRILPRHAAGRTASGKPGPRLLRCHGRHCRALIDAVKPRQTRFTIEMMGWSLPNTTDSYLQLIKAINRPAFGAHMEICNIIESADTYNHNTEIIHECFKKMGRYIVSCHAKDVGPKSTHITEVQ